MDEPIDYKKLLYKAYYKFRHRTLQECPTWYDGCNCFMDYDDFDPWYWKQIAEEEGKKSE